MPYLGIRGNLGIANTRVYGLTTGELEQIKATTQLRMASENQDKCEVTFYNAAMYTINQLEYHLGYVVIAMASMDDCLSWTMFRMPGQTVSRALRNMGFGDNNYN
ncbi:uncharacterized protein [Halyomorpha halys]|uniref:uncharacterized protein n=1 Tax=Halyomorpha halys TaxID=286706 RepID=UPI0006D51761|nr:uncharacterized protein LOC106681086 [Halyomorpha halys]XP_014276722.1 uncharacterized protein LOC106681086 [Halyomorpha halys]XP_014276723.1 uncharacterized protein LOC106681086 [Halyomorpha halys]XP_014276724.1 uncharacterized protein LOC106681086 [Halyomorpha halys]